MQIRKMLVVFGLVIATVGSLASPAFAASLSSTHPANPSTTHSCPGKKGTTVFDTKGCGGSGVHPLTMCYQSACDNVDPYAGQCTGSVGTIDYSSFTYAGHSWQLQQRYSYTCSTRWTRLQEQGAHGYCFGSNSNISVGNNFGNGNGVSSVCDGAWTNMIYAPLGSEQINSEGGDGGSFGFPTVSYT